MAEKVAILFSGGADSVLLVELAKSIKKDILCILVSYGQHHIAELDTAKKYLNKHKLDNITIEIKGYDVNSGLTGSGEKSLYQGVNTNNVPARNTIFLSLAAGICESRNISNIWIGCDMDDFYNKFPDCFQSYISEVNNLFKIAFSYPISVGAPLLGFSKGNVLSMLQYYGIKMDEIYSGYGEFA
jgi:7-cyano-7-deazaguanine synthase